MGFDETLPAAADIHDQAEGQGDVGAACEEGDLSRDAVLVDLEIVLGEAGYQVAVGISHGETEVDQVDIDTKRRLWAAGTRREKRGQAHHERQSLTA